MYIVQAICNIYAQVHSPLSQIYFKHMPNNFFQVCTLNDLCKHSNIFLSFKQKAMSYDSYFLNVSIPFCWIIYNTHSVGSLDVRLNSQTISLCINHAHCSSGIICSIFNTIFYISMYNVQRLKCPLIVLTTRIIRNY